MKFLKDDLATSWTEMQLNHYDLHALLGFGIGFIVGSLKAPWPVTVFLSWLAALAVGFVLEAYQGIVKKAITDNKDYRFTGYGGIVAVPFTLILTVLELNGLWLLAIGVAVVALSYLLRQARN